MSLERVVDTLSGGERSRHALDAARMATRQREVRYYAGAAAASGRGGSSAAAEGFQRRFGGTVGRNDRRFRPARDSRAPATQRTLKRYELTAMSGIKDDINGAETKWIVQEFPAR